MSRKTPKEDLTGVILAGGRGRRMGGRDKGLIDILGIPMAAHVLEALRPQVSAIIISANRNPERYGQLGYPVIEDAVGDGAGPLAGIAMALQAVETEYILTAPCDAPLLPEDLGERLYRALLREGAAVSIVYDGNRVQPLFSIIRRNLLPDLLAFLDTGGRKVETWFTKHNPALADYADRADCFLNVNTPSDRKVVESKLRKPRQR